MVTSLVLAPAALRLMQKRLRALIRVELFSSGPYGIVPSAADDHADSTADDRADSNADDRADPSADDRADPTADAPLCADPPEGCGTTDYRPGTDLPIESTTDPALNRHSTATLPTHDDSRS